MGASTVLRKADIPRVVLAAFLLSTAIQAQSESVRALPVADALGAGRFPTTVPVRLSPDEQWVTYSVIDPHRQPVDGALGLDYAIISPKGVTMLVATADVWVSNVKNGDARNITNGNGASWGGVWSPDSKSVAFFSDRDGDVRVWLWDAATGKSRRVSDVIARPYFAFEQVAWHPDGKQLLVRVLPEGFTLAQVLDRVKPQRPVSMLNTTPNVRVYRWPNSGPDSAAAIAPLTAVSGDLAMIDVRSGAVRRLVHNIKTNAYWLSGQGTDVAYTRRVDDPSTVQLKVDLAVVSLKDGVSRVLARDIPQPFGLSVSWSPDGSQLAYTNALGTAAKTGTPPRGDCFVVSLAGGSPRNVSVRAHPPFGKFYDAPMWHPNGEWVYLTGGDTLWRASASGVPLIPLAVLPGRAITQMVGHWGSGTAWTSGDSGTLHVRTQNLADNRTGIAAVNPVSGSITSIVEEERNYPGIVFGQDAVGSTYVHISEGAQYPPDLWVARGADSIAHPRRLTHLNRRLDDYTYGASRVIEWQTGDGISAHGALTLPAGYSKDKKYPLVVFVYGGDSPSKELSHFGNYAVGGDLRQLLATRGYAVLLPDIPMKAGTPVADIVKAVLPGVNKVIEIGIADPERLGVMGSSYGGYSTLALVTETRRFKAAVSISGFSNLLSQYGELLRSGYAAAANSEQGPGRMVASPWENLTRYVDNSPFFHLDRVETPVLLIHGDADMAVSPARGDETFVALRRLAKTVEYARYADEGHGWWGFADSVDGVERTLSWFERYLK